MEHLLAQENDHYLLSLAVFPLTFPYFQLINIQYTVFSYHLLSDAIDNTLVHDIESIFFKNLNQYLLNRNQLHYFVEVGWRQ